MIARSNEPALRVAFLVKNLPLTAWISDQVLGLTERGVEVRVLAMRRATWPEADPPDPAAAAYRHRVAVVGMAGGRARRAATLAAGAVGALSRRPMAAAGVLSRAGGGGAFRTRVAMAATAWKAQILHVHFGNYAVSLLPLRRITGLPLIVSFYGWDASAAAQQSQGLYDALFSDSACVVSLSLEMKGALVNLGCPPEKIEVVHVAVRGERLRERARLAQQRREPGGATGGAEAAEGPVILSVGRLVEKKGLDDGLEALALVAQRSVPFRFRIVGDGPLRSLLAERARTLGIADRVTFTGELDRDGVFDEMAGADLLLMPSRTASSGDREGTPTVLIEAGALGIPSVATRHAGIPEVVLDGQTGLLARERDVAGLAERLDGLLRDRPLRSRLGEAARARVDVEFELSSQCARLETLYRRVLGRAA